jgi:hypothetical protein
MGKKLWSQIPFRLFALYWLVSGFVNIVEFFPLSKRGTELFTVIYNIFDMPMVLGVFYFATCSASIKKFIRIVAPGFLAAEFTNCLIRGFNYDSLKYLLGAGIIIVLSVIIGEIIFRLQKIKHTSQEKGLLLIYAAMLFEYGTYIVIYIFDYFLPGASSTTDNFLVYYLSSLVALIVAMCGFLTKGVNAPPAAKEWFETEAAYIPELWLTEDFE